MKRQTPEVGSIFVVPLPDGSGSVGQIVGREAHVLNSWTCAFSRLRVGKEEVPCGAPGSKDIISVQFATGDLLKKGVWRIYGRGDVSIPLSMFPFEDLRAKDWVGAKMIGSGILGEFLAAFHGLEFWDSMKDPDYFLKLLLPGVPVPPEIRRKSA